MECVGAGWLKVTLWACERGDGESNEMDLSMSSFLPCPSFPPAPRLSPSLLPESSAFAASSPDPSRRATLQALLHQEAPPWLADGNLLPLAFLLTTTGSCQRVFRDEFCVTSHLEAAPWLTDGNLLLSAFSLTIIIILQPCPTHSARSCSSSSWLWQ